MAEKKGVKAPTTPNYEVVGLKSPAKIVFKGNEVNLSTMNQKQLKAIYESGATTFIRKV